MKYLIYLALLAPAFSWAEGNLLNACKYGNAAAVEAELQAAPDDLERRDADGNTCLLLAVAHSAEVVNVLFKHGANIAAVNNQKAGLLDSFFLASYSPEFPKVLQVLLDANIDFKGQIQSGMTGIYWAIFTGIPKDLIAKIVKAQPAAVNARNSDGQTPLVGVCWAYSMKPNDRIAVAKILIDAGALPNALDDKGSPVMSSCLSNDPPVIPFLKYLISRGGKPTLFNPNHVTGCDILWMSNKAATAHALKCPPQTAIIVITPGRRPSCGNEMLREAGACR